MTPFNLRPAAATAPPADECRATRNARPDLAHQLRESEEQMRQLAARLQTIREEERKHLARELHDKLGRTLTSIKLELIRTITLLKRDRISPACVDRLQSLAGLTEIGLATVKRITTERRPAALDHLGLPAAVRREAIAFQARTGVRCHVTANSRETSLSEEQEIALFRILQEALTNVVRHAGASAVHVRLVERERAFELHVKDNGCGITDAQSLAPGALGLLGMRERSSLIGGTFAIAGRQGKGTVVMVQVPLRGTRAARLIHSRPAPADRADNAKRLGNPKGQRHRREGDAIRHEHQHAFQDGMKPGRKS